jgi:colicin import membrane protein
MVSVDESQDQVQDSHQPTSSTGDSDDGIAALARPSWIKRHVFGVFLAGSLIFHLSFVALVSFFDFRWVTPWMNFRELPVELINEEQVEKEKKKAGSADNKGQTQETQAKPPEVKTEKPAQPLRDQTKPAEKPPENKQSENRPTEGKSSEGKSSGDKSAGDKSEEKKTERGAASQHQPQTAATKQPEAQQKTTQQKELAKQVAQNPSVQGTPKTAETQRSAAASAPVQDQRPPAPQQPQPVPNDPQQPQRADQSAPQALTRLPTFLYQPSDRLSLAIPAPLPTNDADAEPASYKVIVFGMLERAKNYPEAARERHATGNVVIAFSIDDNGLPQNISMLEPSGESDLDTEALAMISRAAPFPAPPAGAQRYFAVNIGFGSR